MLKLYALGYTPNAEGQLHFIGTHAQLLTKLGTPALQVDGNDYRINGGQIFVTFSNNANYVDAITYAIDTDDTGKWRCYHVNAGRIESGFVVFDVTVDWWGTAYNDANVTRLELRALNRKLTNGGEYQQPARVYGLPTYERFTDSKERLDIVFTVVADSGKQAISGNTKSVRVWSLQYTPENLAKVQNIFGTVGTPSMTTTNNAAETIKAWIVPHAWLPSNAVVMYFRTHYNGEDVNIEAEGFNSAIKNYEVSSFTGNPQKQYRFGLKTQSMLLRNTVNASKLWVQCAIGRSDINVTLYQDCDGLDITQSLAVTLTTTDGNLTTGERTSKILGTIAGTVSAGAQIAGGAMLLTVGNPAGVVGMTNGAANLGAIAANTFYPQYNYGQTPGGDGLTNIEGDATTGYYSPLRLISYNAISLRPAYRARMLGALYADYVAYNGLSALVDNALYPLIGEAPSNATWPDATYIEARVEYKGQEAAASVIKTHIARGVLYEVL